MPSPHQFLETGNRTLAVSGTVFLMSTLIAYPLASRFGLATQVLAHLSIVVAAGFFKLGYVLRLAAQHELQNEQAART